MFSKKITEFQIIILILVLGILYILFPSANPSGDTVEYANNIRSGNELFFPHHLLYNAFFYVLVKLLGIVNILRFIYVSNALFAAGCLLFVNAILSSTVERKIRISLILLLGSCFGFMRYATTGETYIIPLFFLLGSSYWALRKKFTVGIALLTSIACLFHQICIFWWLGLLIFILITNNERRFRTFLAYGLVSCMVPITYLLAFYLTENDSSSVFDYLVHDYRHHEGVEFAIKKKAFLLTPINLVRTFYQVHGYILPLIQKHFFLIIFVFASVVLGIAGCFKFRKRLVSVNTGSFERNFALTHLIIFGLQLFFAFLSEGNAEFMVMLPFELALFAFIYYRVQRFPMALFAASLFTWNVSLGLLPLHLVELTHQQALVRYVEQHPDEIYYVRDRQLLANDLRYRNPQKKYSLFQLKPNNEAFLDSLVQRHSLVMTDILTPLMMSRASLVAPNIQLPPNLMLCNPDTIPFDLGFWVMSEIRIKQPE
jgi:hypothetical protein